MHSFWLDLDRDWEFVTHYGSQWWHELMLHQFMSPLTAIKILFLLHIFRHFRFGMCISFDCVTYSFIFWYDLIGIGGRGMFHWWFSVSYEIEFIRTVDWLIYHIHICFLEKHAKRIFEMSNEYQIPAVQDACEEVMAKTVSEINLIGQWEGKDHIYPGCANKTLDMIMFGSLYSLHKLIKSACENISRVPMDKITCLGKYKKLPEHCKIEILLARIKRCDRKKFYKPGMNDENDNVSTMVQCELLPTPEPPSRPLSRSGTVSPQQPANQNAANPQQQPANHNSANQLPANQNAADIQQPANQNGLNRPQWIPPPLLRPTHPMGPVPAVNPFLRPPGFSNQQQPRGVNPVH